MSGCPQDKKSAGGPGGKSRFDQVVPAGEGPYAGKTVLQEAQALGYAVVTNKAGLAGAHPGKKLLGLFTSSHMSLDWAAWRPRTRPPAPVAARPDCSRPPSRRWPT